MQNFEIEFGLEVKIGPRKHRQGNLFKRIISAQTLEIAKKVAEAMLGEEVYAWQYLSEVLSVTPTEKDPFISPLCTFCCVWERVLQRLGLVGTGETVQFLHYQTAHSVIISGVAFTLDQIQRILSHALRP